MSVSAQLGALLNLWGPVSMVWPRTHLILAGTAPRVHRKCTELFALLTPLLLSLKALSAPLEHTHML